MAVKWRHRLAFQLVAAGLIAVSFAAQDRALAADLPQPAPVPVAYTPPPPDWIVTVGIEGRIIPAWLDAAGQRPPCR
jgi:hypothetical protein